ncbi:MAG: HlyC/CorC family transporter [Anaerolineae bacterium]|nr:HlyC/CorC family transporter [Anaerolineae bacterium]
MANVSLEMAVILLLILVNGLLAMAEMAVVSARRARLQERADEGDAGAQRALEVAERPARFLSTIQIGITLVGVLAGAFGGATIAQELAEVLAGVPLLARYSEAVAVAIVVITITYLSLVLGELVPKQLALNDPERIASAFTPPIHTLSHLAAPLVSLLTASTQLVVRLLGARRSAEPPVTESEIRIMIEEGTEAGVFEEAEQDMVKGVFRLGDRRVDAVMTPRTEIEWLDTEDPAEEIRQAIMRSAHSRFPVATTNLDHVQGMVRARDVLGQCLAGEALDLQGVLHSCYFVPESALALSVLDTLKRTGTSMAFVIDEHGGLQGLVTVTDIVEAIVGDLPEAGELDQPRAVQREDGSWLLDGLLPVDEFKEMFDLDSLPGEEEAHYQTLGGFVMDCLGHIPETGDRFAQGSLEFEVIDMDAFRVDKVLVRRKEE